MIRIAAIEDIPQIVDLVFMKNNQPQHNSAYCCKEYDAIKRDFLSMIESKQNAVVAYFEEETLLGVLGVIVDEEKSTADCCGPFVAVEDFVGISAKMLEYARDHFNAGLKYYFFFDTRNRSCIDLMNAIRAENQGNEFILTLKRDNFIKKEHAVSIVPLPGEYWNSFVNLHDTVFPDIYVSGRDITNSIGENRKVFCIIEDKNVVGYGVLRRTANSSRATAEVIAVEESKQGNGYGRALLNELAKQAFGDESVDILDLVVENTNTNALNLYYSVGFQLNVENCFYIAKL